MSHKIIQDIYVKKSIRNIKKSDIRDGFYSEEEHSDGRYHKKQEAIVDKFPIEKHEHKQHHHHIEGKRHVSKDSLIILWTICVISIGTLLFFLSSYFATTSISITPKSQLIVMNDTYNITSDKNSPGLHFQVMTVTKDLSENPETDGEEYVEKKATGRAVIYNNFSTAKQRLINNTRLETKDGLIYRIRESVEIPGIKTIDGVKTPGSIEVEIIADVAGDKYNMKLTDFKGDFTIPGFKGSTKFNAFYARLNSDVVGGYIGNIKKVSDEKVAEVRTQLKESLKTDLIKDVYSKVPAQYILFNDNYFVQCKDLDNSVVDGEYLIPEECVLNAIIFNKEELASFIANEKINDFDNSKVEILWNDNNTVSIEGSTEKPWNETVIKAKFSGSIQVVWQFDKNKIIDSILGQNKDIVPNILEDNKNVISGIEYSIRPMWRNVFPDNPSKIKIIDTVRDMTK